MPSHLSYGLFPQLRSSDHNLEEIQILVTKFIRLFSKTAWSQ